MHTSDTVPAHESDQSAIVCSLDAAGLAERVAEFERLFATALLSHEREPARLRLVLAVSTEGEAAVRDLFRRENECCQFFSFAIHADEQGLVVTMGVPHGAEPMLDGFEALAAASARATSQWRWQANRGPRCGTCGGRRCAC